MQKHNLSKCTCEYNTRALKKVIYTKNAEQIEFLLTIEHRKHPDIMVDGWLDPERAEISLD
jgi:hypothetical protein